MPATPTWAPAEADLQHYHDQGYFITPPICDADTIAGLRAAFDALWEEQRQAAVAAGDPDRDFVRTRPFINECYQRHPTCRAFFRQPAFQAIVAAIVGDDADLCYNQAVIKPCTDASTDNAFAWHQDTHYALGNTGDQAWNRELMLDDSRTFQSWLAVSDTSVANGTLQVLPGSHRDGFPAYRKVREDHGELAAQVDTNAAIPVELQAGQMLVFSGLLLHASGPNHGGETRYVYQFSTAEPGARQPQYSIPIRRDGNLIAS